MVAGDIESGRALSADVESGVGGFARGVRFEVIADVVEAGLVGRTVARAAAPAVDEVVAEIEDEAALVGVLVGAGSRIAAAMVGVDVMVIRNITVGADE